ncbi:hypothetical protein [Domibacillus mangrovi]|uniref:Uncharacterized protein n=1 Tax=Domibacillus mangrovi TaxID=1714354 RepID=A0A1Q5NZR1_9BACI|nr:hypothetical protein [Domibacillus mangrovi]OKL35497.1 hypothetical protein BLL40_15175 [Domibacillus mangrovi]
MQRDPKTGRFLPGNQVAAGNRGNQKPKWGNKNAVKHGFYQTFIVPKMQSDGSLHLYKKGVDIVAIQPEGYRLEEDGSISIRDDVAAVLDEMGFVLERRTCKNL